MRFLLRRDRAGELCFASLQGATAEALRAEHPDFPRDLATMVLAEPEGDGVRLRTNSDGIVRALELTGGARWLSTALRAVPRPVRDAVYVAFARNRYRLFGHKDVCDLPSPEDRARLLP